jgi:manganese/zinc/iron transport system permease protein
VVAQARRRAAQKLDFAVRMLVVHILNHEGAPEQVEECREVGIHRHLNWRLAFTEQVVARACERGLVARSADLLTLTDPGRALAQGAVANPDA